MNEVKDILFDPQQISMLGIEKIKNAKESENERFLTGFPGKFDEKYVMFRRKKVTGILADTSNYKTGLMTHISRKFTEQLAQDEIGLFFTWEDSVEDFAVNDFANISMISLPVIYGQGLTDENYTRLMKSATERAGMPLWIAGHSEFVDSRRPRMTMTDVFAAAAHIVDVQKKKIAFTCFDYLQRINRSDLRGDMREQYMEIMDKVKDYSNAFNSCTIIGTQVRREIEKREWRQPNEHDAQETSNFEHTCDGMVSLQLPARYRSPYPDKDALITEIGNTTVYVTSELLSAKILKQKKGAFGDMFFWNVDYGTNDIVNYIPPSPKGKTK